MFDLTGKVSLVTGGNGGIGLGIAKALKKAGSTVIIWGRDEEKCKKSNLAYTIVDVTQEDQVRSYMTKIAMTHGRLDFVVANAGITNWSTPFHETSIWEWRKIFSVNMEGVFFTFKHAITEMLELDNGGSLLGISSGSTIFGFPRSQHYASTKGGVIAMIQSIAVEYARYGIRANAVIPGWIQTNMTQPLIDNPKFVEKNLKRIPMRRWGQPEDIGNLAVYLASDEASYHTGDTVTVDGGYSKF